MLVEHLRSALRTLRRNPFYSLISIGCLAIGIAVSMTILLYVLHEHSYDKWQANAKRTFLAAGRFKFGDAVFNVQLLSAATGPMVKQADSDVESFLRVYQDTRPMNVESRSGRVSSFTERDHFVFADSNFFRFFSFRLLKGDPARVLDRPKTVVLSERTASMLFGKKEPVGQILRLNGRDDLEVTGVAADPPSNTLIPFDVIVSLSSMSSIPEYKWVDNPPYVQGGQMRTWLRLTDAGAAGRVVRTLDRLSNVPVPGQPEKDRDHYFLTPIGDVHLHNNNFSYGDNIRYLQFFPLAAGLVLLLALVNYMSLATARAAVRAKEVGVRKVMGAGRGRIAGQFYTESAVYALISFALGALLFLLVRPAFFGLLQQKIDSAFLLEPLVLAAFAGLLVVVIVLSGSYPSLVLSAFKPVMVLYGKLSRRRGGERVRKGFIVLQFTISMSLVLCSVIVTKELHYIRHADTGMDRDNVIMIRFNKMAHFAAFKREVEALPGIAGTTASQFPLYGGMTGWAIKGPGSDRPVQLLTMYVDERFISLLGLQWKEKPADTSILGDLKHIVLNETAVEALGFSGDPIGQKLALTAEKQEIAGVLKDFNYGSLRNKIGSLGIFIDRDTDSTWGTMNGCLLGKIRAYVNIPTTLEAIRRLFSKYDKQTAFTYEFADEAFDRQYKAEDRLAGLFAMFTAITVMIACLGLFALATFSAQQRVKEIGIRKVMGASVASIGGLLSRDFLRPVLLAVVIAIPLSWWVMNRWLEDFAYRTDVPWWMFTLAGLGMLGVSLATVLFRSLRAARGNPVEALRSE